jgi:hypothetical protein
LQAYVQPARLVLWRDERRGNAHSEPEAIFEPVPYRMTRRGAQALFGRSGARSDRIENRLL